MKCPNCHKLNTMKPWEGTLSIGWERGEIEIPRAAAFALGELFEHPVVTTRKLDAFAG
jgi:hypothetical protein